MLLVLLRLPRVLFVVLRFSCPFLSLLVVFCLLHIYMLLYCFVLSVTSPGGHDTSFYYLFIYLFIILFVLFVSSVVISAVALSTLITALQCSISASSFCEHRACISLGGRIGTDTGCAACRRGESAV